MSGLTKGVSALTMSHSPIWLVVGRVSALTMTISYESLTYLVDGWKSVCSDHDYFLFPINHSPIWLLVGRVPALTMTISYESLTCLVDGWKSVYSDHDYSL